MMWLTKPTPDDVEQLDRSKKGLWSPTQHESWGTWWGRGCRILEMIDEPTRFGFVYGTIEGHTERGEEVFLVEQRDDGAVVYSLFAMSRPGRWFSWPSMPIARHAQGRFRPTSADSMRRAVTAARTLDAEV